MIVTIFAMTNANIFYVIFKNLLEKDCILSWLSDFCYLELQILASLILQAEKYFCTKISNFKLNKNSK